MNQLEARAREIAEFLGIPEADAIAKLSRGFGELHNEVTADFRRANPQTDEELLNWYRTTDKYIWELTAYHLDPGFNYSGMCEGIVNRLRVEAPGGKFLALGDGIGDLTLALHRMDADSIAVYHDLARSRTAEFAWYRFLKQTGDHQTFCLAEDWSPKMDWFGHGYDAIVSLDFLEHCVDVEGYVRAIYAALKPGGLLCAQNGFDCGSGPDGSIPMHLSRNDKYAHATPETNGMALWDHLLIKQIGFIQEGSNWYRKK